MERDPRIGASARIKPETRSCAIVAQRADRRGNTTARPEHCGNWGKAPSRLVSSAAIFPRTEEALNAADPPFDDERRERVRATD